MKNNKQLYTTTTTKKNYNGWIDRWMDDYLFWNFHE